jgi:FtsH-binding integral membrane protein
MGASNAAMTRGARERSRPVEMTSDRRFASRVVRLAVTSVIALAAIFAQWAWTGNGNLAILIALGGGWILMPTLLMLSLRRPELRYGVVVPAAAVGLALVAICLWNSPPSPIARSGWILISSGVLLGGFLGAWFWFRWLPVPRQLDDPYSPGRWAMIAVHAGLIVTGLGLLLLSDLI